MTKFFREIWRRRVLQVAIPYGVGAWVLVQVAEVILDAFEAPPWIMQGLLVLLVLGFPVAVVLAWVFDITPEHHVVRTGKADFSDPEETEPEPEPEPAPALSVEMGGSERRQVTMMHCAFEVVQGDDPEVDPEYLRDAISAIGAKSRELTQRFRAFPLPGSTEELNLVFGYPQAGEDDARRSVAAGLALIDEIKSMPEIRSNPDQPGFTVRAGIATGLVVVDESGGDDQPVSFIGQVPRMASWLQQQAALDSLVIGPRTQKLVAGHYQVEAIETHPQSQFGTDFAAYRVEQAILADSSLAEDQALTGREDEMRLLEDLWDNVRDGGGQFAVLQGEPGIGKSSMLRAFVRHVLEDDEVTFVPCHCSPYEQDNPLSPVIQVISDSVLDFQDQDNDDIRIGKLREFVDRQSLEASEAVPLLASLLSLEGSHGFSPPSGSAQIVRMQTLELILDMITQGSARKPMLVIVEDLHWADPSTLEMIQMMVDRGPSPGLFLLFSTRPGFQANWIKRSTVQVQELAPLSRRASRDLLEYTADGVELPKALVDRIIEETDGNPLFIQELTLAVLESDSWREMQGRGEAEDLSWLEIPATLQDSLAARVDHLGSAKALLQLCSVLGREFDYSLLRTLSGTENEAALKEELAQIVDAELMFQRGTFRNPTYTFRHILIQETAYNSILKSKRRELHERTAEILEEEISDASQKQPALLAYHYTEGGNMEKAIPNWTTASKQSLSSFALREAVEQSRKGIRLLESLPESPQRAAQEVPLQTILGTALLSIHGYSDKRVRKVFTRALELCELIGDAPQLFQVAVGLWMYYFIAGRFDEALDLARRLLRIAETTDNPAQHLQARYCLAFILYLKADFLTAKAHLETALENERADCDYAAQSASGDDTRIHVRVLLALVNWHLGFPKSAARQVQEANQIAREVQHPWGITFAAFYSAWFHQLRSDAGATLEYADRAARIAEEKGFRFWMPLVNYMRSWASNRDSSDPSRPRERDGVENMQTALQQYRGIGSGMGVTYLSFRLAEEKIGLGMLDEAESLLEEARELLQANGELFVEAEYHRLHGRICLELFRQNEDQESLERASEHFQRALARAQHHESKALELRSSMDRAEVLSLQGKHEQAQSLLDGIVQRFDEMDDSGDCSRAVKMLKELKKKT